MTGYDNMTADTLSYLLDYAVNADGHNDEAMRMMEAFFRLDPGRPGNIIHGVHLDEVRLALRGIIAILHKAGVIPKVEVVT